MASSLGRLGGCASVALLAYGLLCLLVFRLQRSFIYFPSRWDEQAASRANPGYEEVRFPTADGETLHGWLLRREDAPWTVVIFHGNAGNLEGHEAVMVPLRTLDLQVLLFDYRGYGLSTGRPTQEGLLRDGEAVVSYVERDLGVPSDRMVYFGNSLGTGVAVLLAARRPPGRLILESAYDSLAAVARPHYPFLPVGLLLRDRFDAGAVIGGIRSPILFLHPAEDEIIPVARGRALFGKASGPKRFVTIPGARHNDPSDSFPPLYLDAIREFLGR